MNTNKSNFTIVVPTMWKYPPFLRFLRDLVDFPLVEEVVLINNNRSETPDDPVLVDSKIRMIVPEQNIYVNPAFNIGVELSNTDNICLLNDDLVFDLKILMHVQRSMNLGVGVMGICPGLAEFNQTPFTSGTVQIVPWNGQHTFGFGCLMFVHKKNWLPIPESFKLYYGDNWIFDTALMRGLTNYMITDALFHTPYATTCKDMQEKTELLDAETEPFHRAMAELRQQLAGNN